MSSGVSEQFLKALTVNLLGVTGHRIRITVDVKQRLQVIEPFVDPDSMPEKNEADRQKTDDESKENGARHKSPFCRANCALVACGFSTTIPIKRNLKGEWKKFFKTKLL